MVVFGESDTVAHHFWRFHDPASPRHAPSRIADAIRPVYRALDAADRAAWWPRRAGMPAWPSCRITAAAARAIACVHLNRCLAQQRPPALPAARRGGVPRRVRGARRCGGAASGSREPLVRRAPRRRGPSRRGRALRRHRLGAHGGVLGGARLSPERLAQRARAASREGIVAPRDYERTRDVVAARADGVARRRRATGRRARLASRGGVFTDRRPSAAPDLLLELRCARTATARRACRSAGPGPALRRLPPAEHGAGKGSGMNGAHRRDGLFVLAGPGVRPSARSGAPTSSTSCRRCSRSPDVPVPLGLDGVPIAAALARRRAGSARSAARGERRHRQAAATRARAARSPRVSRASGTWTP